MNRTTTQLNIASPLNSAVAARIGAAALVSQENAIEVVGRLQDQARVFCALAYHLAGRYHQRRMDRLRWLNEVADGLGPEAYGLPAIEE